MCQGIIYCYRNIVNNKYYVGQTTNEPSRRSAFRTKKFYCTSLNNGGKLSKFDNARHKYGLESFEYLVLDTVEAEDSGQLRIRLDQLEQDYIKKYDSFYNGYNCTEGGFGGRLSEESRHRISDSLKGRPMSPLTYEKLCLTGYPHTEESKKKLSEKAKQRYKDPRNHPMYGKHHSEESKLKNSNSRKGKCKGAENKQSRPVQCFKDGKFIREFICLADAAEFCGRDRKNTGQISKCCSGKAVTAYGYVWKYAERK